MFSQNMHMRFDPCSHFTYSYLLWQYVDMFTLNVTLWHFFFVFTNVPWHVKTELYLKKKKNINKKI